MRGRWASALWIIACVTAALTAQAEEGPGVRILDDFGDPSAWTLAVSDDVTATLRPTVDAHGQALCIDYDFGRVTGYIAARRALPIDWPTRYELGLSVRGDAPANDLQVKLVDASGQNVWWARRPDLRVGADWQPLRFRQRQIEFAWGPTADRALRRTASVELVIASGSGAGKGRACFDRLSLRTLADEPPAAPLPTARAGSALPGHPATAAIDGDVATDWQPATSGPGAVLTVDWGRPREFNLLSLRWRDGAAASRYRLAFSDDGEHWRDERQVDRARGSLQRLGFADAEARGLRIAVDDAAPAGRPVALADVALSTEAPDADAFFALQARDAPRGRYPRAYSGEQPYWTVFGVDGGPLPSLLGEDGAIEPVPGAGALEPFLVADGRVVTWADAKITQTLRDGDLPMPSAHWRTADGLTLDIDAFAAGTATSAQALARYTVGNATSRPRTVTLALAWRPFQVNPPTQFLAHHGGASRIEALAWDGASLRVGADIRLQAITPPNAVRLEPLATGAAPDWLGEPPSRGDPHRVDDPAGFPSGVLRYALRLGPGERRQVRVALPVHGAPTTPTAAAFVAAERQARAHWRERLDRVRITGAAEVEGLARTLRASLGQMLVLRSGPALQPGPRAYARSWIRDGAMMSSALLRLGQDDAARDFIGWYAPFQFASGKVPCCATSRGADPVPENDSDGEFIFAADELRRYTADTATAAALWTRVAAAATHMEGLRQSERTLANRTPERNAYFGLMPPSISHEGYSDRPAYSYWDDFWAATGYRSAAAFAAALGHADDARRFAAQQGEFVTDLVASLVASSRQHGLDVLPGAADRGDVDPTSSSVALAPGDLLGVLPPALVRNTFERYWRDFVARRDAATWDVYTPYEWRNVGALLRLGERQRALDAVAFFRRDRRPAAWEQWAEVVGREPRAPRFIGDMPHGWVGSDQIRAVLDLFAYESPQESRLPPPSPVGVEQSGEAAFAHQPRQVLVLAAGVPMHWFEGPGLSVQGLRTPYGALAWQAQAGKVTHGRRSIEFRLQPLRELPEGGIEVRGPWPATSEVRVDGLPVAGPADRIVLTRTPARVRILLPAR